METLDLRGLLCPLTWARAKYALSRLKPGAELVVLVDHRPAVPDIRRNAEETGNEVLSSRETQAGVWDAIRDSRCEYYYITVRRQALERVRDTIGVVAYYNGNYPPHVPVWRFRKID